ncbi:hypothetical protein SNEBB_010442 [Seison nebaliae]|nr:hypothetical protein SNEBB_010442 [Seison nebaliae]
MGIPCLFNWLQKRYKQIIKVKIADVQEQDPEFKFDNLYLDMNAIIHPCTHPEASLWPTTNEERLNSVISYVDMIVKEVRPQKMLFLAIDGVAPKAKMNQQRSRRFKAAIDQRLENERISEKIEVIKAGEKKILEGVNDFDLNCITPGTEFMEYLATALRLRIVERMNNNVLWKNLMVILSDSNIPGEGEHKIMDYIRRQRYMKNYDPNQRHIIYGNDADLIMLGLATHEAHMTIIREEFEKNTNMFCRLCTGNDHKPIDCPGLNNNERANVASIISHKTPVFLYVQTWILRDYLANDLTIENHGERNIDRLIDDWVFLCFFVGNDFLPQLPFMEIYDNAIPSIVNLYKETIRKHEMYDQYLTANGNLNLSLIQKLLLEINIVYEDSIFQKKRNDQLGFARRRRVRRFQEKNQLKVDFKYRNAISKMGRENRMDGVNDWQRNNNDMPQPLTSFDSTRNLSYGKSLEIRKKYDDENMAVANKLKRKLLADLNDDTTDTGSSDNSDGDTKMKTIDETKNKEEMEEKVKEDPFANETTEDIEKKNNSNYLSGDEEDEVQLHREGWKERYYQCKLGIDGDHYSISQMMSNEYIRGMAWVMKYYYQGCASWDWFYPYHYAPFASDFRSIETADIKFDINNVESQPASPFEQLMCVFPAESRSLIPQIFHKFMLDEDSPIIDFYPNNFKIDLNGKRQEWQGVYKLPFADSVRLRETIKDEMKNLSKEEKIRNSLGKMNLFVPTRLNNDMEELCKKILPKEKSKTLFKKQTINHIFGSLKQISINSPDFKIKIKEISNRVISDRVISDLDIDNVTIFEYRFPSYPENYEPSSLSLENAKYPKSNLSNDDFEAVIASNYRNRSRNNNNNYRANNNRNYYMNRDPKRNRMNDNCERLINNSLPSSNQRFQHNAYHQRSHSNNQRQYQNQHNLNNEGNFNNFNPTQPQFNNFRPRYNQNFNTNNSNQNNRNWKHNNYNNYPNPKHYR